MAYVHASKADVEHLLTIGGYGVSKENIESCLHGVFGFSKQRNGEFGVEDAESSLRPEDIGKNRWYGCESLQHKTQFSGVVLGERYVGYERKDEVWIEHGNPSEVVLLEIRNDPSYNFELSQLSKRRSIS